MKVGEEGIMRFMNLFLNEEMVVGLRAPTPFGSLARLEPGRFVSLQM